MKKYEGGTRSLKVKARRDEKKVSDMTPLQEDRIFEAVE